MKTQPTSRGVLLAGVVILGTLQACASTEPMVEPTIAEAAPGRSAGAPVDAMAPVPAEASNSAPESPAVQSAVEPVQPSLVAAGISSGSPLPPAKSMTDLTVQRAMDSVVVIITGDGELTYDVTKLSGNRLVIDLLNVVNGTKRQAVPVRHKLMRQIRIGVHQFPQAKVRLVLDLDRSVPYTIEKSGAQLRVKLSEQAPGGPAPQETQPTTRSGPVTSEMVARMSPRHSLPVPDRLKFLAPMTPLAQPIPTQMGEISSSGGTERFTGKRISLDFQDAEISSVLRLIADVSGLNMVVGEAVKAKVTLKLLNVPWDQGLDLILKLNNLGQIREGNILWIDTLANITKLRDDAARAKEATLKAEELVTRIIYLNYGDAAKSVDVAKSNLSPRGEIKVDARTNALVVRDIPDNLVKVEKIIHDLDQRTPQVQIEARIVQASKNFARGLGIQWGLSSIRTTSTGSQKDAPITINIGASGSFLGQTSDFLVNLAAAASGVSVPGTTAGLTVGKFLGTTGTLDLRLSAGEALGQTKIVSAPKIITLDNKPAKLEQGSQIPFSTTSLQGTQTTFVDATLTLNVTPHVIPHADTVRLEIKVTKNALGAVTVTAGPTIDKKEATSEILLKNGETTVLGGIFEENRSDSTQGVPWFNRIPFLGWLFKNEGVSVTQTELLVFVTPTLIKE